MAAWQVTRLSFNYTVEDDDECFKIFAGPFFRAGPRPPESRTMDRMPEFPATICVDAGSSCQKWLTF